MSDKLKSAVKILCDVLKEDKSEGSYYYSWQANIAMAFQDAYNLKWKELNEFREGPPKKPNIHEIANNAAKNFLEMLISLK